VTLKPGLVVIKVIVNISVRQIVLILLLMFNSNYSSVLHRFETFDYEKYCNLEILVRGHSRSSN